MELQYLNRSVRLPSTMSEAAERLDGVDDDWQMNDTERSALLALVSTLKPKCAIEVGVYKGGSLAILAAHSSKVYALDINPACETAYAENILTFRSSPVHQNILSRSSSKRSRLPGNPWILSLSTVTTPRKVFEETLRVCFSIARKTRSTFFCTTVSIQDAGKE